MSPVLWLRKVVPMILITFLLQGCNLLSGAATVAGLTEPQGISADANLDVGANVQLGKVNNNTKTSNKSTDKRLISAKSETTNTAKNITQNYSIPWWCLLITAFAGILVNPFGLYRDYLEVRNMYK